LFKNLDKPEEINKVAWSRRYKHLEQGDTILEHVASETGSYFISKHQIICPSERCDVIIDREMGFVDSSHWSLIGMKYYGRKLLETPDFKTILSK
jgi:hypothetical protein